MHLHSAVPRSELLRFSDPGRTQATKDASQQPPVHTILPQKFFVGEIGASISQLEGLIRCSIRKTEDFLRLTIPSSPRTL
jgi:hypothetical protein